MTTDPGPHREELHDRLHASVGSLVSAFVHNLNNYLVGVMGNIDLAGLYSEEPETAKARIADARAAAMSIRDFLVELTRFRPVDGDWTSESFAASTAVAALACGRSMSLTIADLSLLPERLPVSDLGFRTLMLGLLSWAVRCCAGTGSIQAGVSTSPDRCQFLIQWDSPDETSSAVEQDPGPVPEWISRVAQGFGAVLTTGETEPDAGRATLTFPLGTDSSE